MALPSVGGGQQLNDGNLNEAIIGTAPVPATATSTATLTAAQLTNGIILGTPGSSAATYTLPTVALLEATLTNAVKTGASFDFHITNIDGNGSGVITVAVGTGWTITGLATIAATAGTPSSWRAIKTGVGTWTAYRI